MLSFPQGSNNCVLLRHNGIQIHHDKIIACYPRHRYDIGFGVNVIALCVFLSMGWKDYVLLRDNGLKSHDDRIIACYTRHRYDMSFGVYVTALCDIFPGDVMTVCY